MTTPVQLTPGARPAVDSDHAGLPGFELGDTLSSFGPEGLKGNSWVLRNKTTGETAMETCNPALVRKLNTEVYEAVPVGRHLADLNDRSTPASKWMRRDEPVAATAAPNEPIRTTAPASIAPAAGGMLSANDALASVAEAPRRTRRARA